MRQNACLYIFWEMTGGLWCTRFFSSALLNRVSFELKVTMNLSRYVGFASLWIIILVYF